ncbi:MAG: hypothetical protein IKA34_11540 [Bacteroidales bacterium]|jgi:hypothetical protein|nr:hypothetical protein [Bacteroidales bacterium]MBQ8573284.1 hypothetical protein [Bacteroidales bacterium]MBR1961176.1 hypothetical protein [Bacteroidales bacterium]
MILKYRVSLPGIKGFARVYEVKGSASLYSFHKQMRADMDFPQDQVVLFKAFDKDGEVAARYSVFTDFGFGTIDHVTAEQCHKRGEDKFIYFYDTTNVKSVIVTFEGVAEERRNVIYPLLVETKGPNPIEFENGYVAFEDLPDDKKKDPDDDDFEDDDIDVDEEADDETEEIYDDDDE